MTFFCDREHVRRAIEGKRVAIVGSGPGVLSNVPGWIDGHEVTCRVNNYKTSERAGFRCDIHYSFFGSSIKKTAAELKRDGVKLCIAKCPDAQVMESTWHSQNRKMNGVDFRYIYVARRKWWFCPVYIPSVAEFVVWFDLLGGHVPTTGFSALLDVLSYRPREVFLTGFDFFASGIHNVNERWTESNKADPIRHVPQAERAWLAENLDKYPIRLDPALSELMGRT